MGDWDACLVSDKYFKVCESDLWPPLSNKSIYQSINQSIYPSIHPSNHLSLSLSLPPDTKINPRAEFLSHQVHQIWWTLLSSTVHNSSRGEVINRQTDRQTDGQRTNSSIAITRAPLRSSVAIGQSVTITAVSISPF